MIRRKFLILSSALLLSAVALKIVWPRRWKYIVIHHSGGNFGNIEFLQKVHRERQAQDPIDAIPYHYIIGNGNGMQLGEVASDWRQLNNIWGAHVSINNVDHNFRGIGICLIGNYEHAPVPEKQYLALLNLVKKLQQKYSITLGDIQGHGMISGEQTKCPGKYFPMARLTSDLA